MSLFGRDANADMVFQHYPKLRKYVALFPPTTDGRSKGGDAGESETGAVREEVRRCMRERMDKGEISNQPEEDCSAG